MIRVAYTLLGYQVKRAEVGKQLGRDGIDKRDSRKGQLLPVGKAHAFMAQQVGAVKTKGQSMTNQGDGSVGKLLTKIGNADLKAGQRHGGWFPFASRLGRVGKGALYLGGVVIHPARSMQLIKTRIDLHW